MCKHYKITLEKCDRHFIDEPQYNNCVLCLSEHKGPMTQEEIGKYLNLSKMRVCQIEKQAINKLDKEIKKVLQYPF